MIVDGICFGILLFWFHKHEAETKKKTEKQPNDECRMYAGNKRWRFLVLPNARALINTEWHENNERTIDDDDDDDENNDKEPKRHEVRQGSAKELDNSRTRKHCEKREIS